MNLSADKITYAIIHNKNIVVLNSGECTQTIYNFNYKPDADHCLGILSNQIRLIQLNMADTRKIYGEYQLQFSFNKLLHRG